MAPIQMKGSQGQMVNAEQLTFTPIKEGISEYQLSNGKLLKIRMILAEIYVLDEKDPTTGKNAYFIKTAPVVSTEDLKE